MTMSGSMMKYSSIFEGFFVGGTFGVVGIDGSMISKSEPRRITHRLASFENIAIGFGMFMALRREDYVPIPEEMKNWGRR